MRTRAIEIPFPDEDEKIVADPEVTLVDSPTMVGIPVQVIREGTRDLDMTLRNPAESRFFIRAGFEAGADTDVIANSIAACVDPSGHVDWVIGPTWLALQCRWHVVVNLSDPAVPPERRVAAWRPIKER